jgi:NAD-reducing hydrogenase large subunit
MATRKATSKKQGQEPVTGAAAAQPTTTPAGGARSAEARRPALKKITINHVSRIEGHARITIKLDDAGQVADAQFHVTQIRGFEKFIEGRPYYEMPSITSRICGICPVSHELASSKACDEIMAVRIPAAAGKLRELIHCAQFVQSHALSFFHLSAPDLLLGMDSDPAKRNIAGLLEEHPDALRDGIALRKFGQQVIERLAKERIHPSWIVPGGVNAPFDPQAREKTLAELPAAMAIVKRTLVLWKKTLDGFPNEIESFSNFPTMYCGLVAPDGSLRLYDGNLRFIGPDGSVVADQVKPDDYATYIGEASLPDSYLKAPYYKPVGYPDGIYRVGPLARLNVADRCGTPEADTELEEYRGRLGRIVQSGFHYHYARLIEVVYALERMQELLDDPAVLGTKVRAHAGVNDLEGIGIIEAPRGTLIHHYKVDENGAMTWANLIVATGHNNLAIGRGILQVARRFIDGNKIQEGALNRVSALVRAYDPCLSCSTHALGMVPLLLQLRGPDGQLLDEARTE